MALSKKQVLMLLLAFTMILLLPAAKTVFADQQSITNAQGIELFVGDTIIIKSDQLSIQRVFLQGNLSAASYTPAQYPTNEFTFTSMSPGPFLLKLFFNYTTGYKVDVQTSNQTASNPTVRLIPGVSPFFQITEPPTNSTTYYLSGGPSELDVNAIFQPSPISSNVYSSPSLGLLGWTGSFGDAFPLWVKLLYLVLGVQFFTVGGLWIRRESARRRSSSRMFDLGDKIYLWVDIAFRFLLISFAALGLIMGGEIIITLILRYMFLITVTPLSLWNLFSLGFAFGAVVITYLVRAGLERGFDLKPIQDE